MTDEPTDETENEAEEQPEIDDDEMADMSAVADAVESASKPDDEETEEEESADEDGSTPDLSSPDALDDESVTIGRVYTNLLGMGACLAQDELGSGLEKERSEALEEYAEMARELEIDDAVDDWMEEHGGPDQLTPGQTIIAMTAVWGAMVVMDDPEILANLGGDDNAE